MSHLFYDRVDYAIQSTLSTFDESSILAAGIVGSTARGYFDKYSDIDVLVVSELELPEFTTFQIPYELTISTVSRKWFLPYEAKKNFDFAELRVISDLSSAYPFIDKICFFENAKRINKTAKLHSNIKNIIYNQAADSLSKLNETTNAIERKLLIAHIANISTTLILANSHIRTTKPRWTWRSVLELNPLYGELISRVLKLVPTSSLVDSTLLLEILENSLLENNKEGVNKNYLHALLKTSDLSENSLESAYIKDLLINWFLKNESKKNNKKPMDKLKSIISNINTKQENQEEIKILMSHAKIPNQP